MVDGQNRQRNALTILLDVDVTAIDANGFEVGHGCTQANDTLPVDEAFDRSIRSALSESLRHRLEQTFKQAIRDALTGHVVKEWPRTLPPNQHAVMAYTTTDPNYRLRITIEYEDEAGYQWRRTDTSQPKRMDEEALRTAGVAESGRPTARCRTI
jgi:hypothetical protein